MQSEISPFAFESWAFWTGVVAVGVTAAGALLGCLLFWFSSKVNCLKDERGLAEETQARTPAETLSYVQQSANRTGKGAVAFTAAGAMLGCLSWWFSFTDRDMKEKARMRFESDYAARMKAAENDLIKSRRETTKALADVAAAKERTGKLEIEAASLRERVAREEDLIKAAEAQSEKAKKETARVRKSTAKALADLAAANERAAQAESALMKVKERRVISDQQRTRLHHALKPIQKGPVKIIAVLGDEEAGKFAKEVASILKDAGWIDIHVNRGVFSGGIDGFEIRVRDRQKVPVFALQMARAFDSIGLDPSLVHDPSVAEGTMEIIIGSESDSG
ncbi:MAG: hypothetical protein CV089_20715 [Nitrospira sp. WS110]|nr:hypothetical protein [Nitrospira sp. WS110]